MDQGPDGVPPTQEEDEKPGVDGQDNMLQQDELIRLTIWVPPSPFPRIREQARAATMSKKDNDPNEDGGYLPIEVVLNQSDTLNDAKNALLESLEGIHLGSTGYFYGKDARAADNEGRRLPEYLELSTLFPLEEEKETSSSQQSSPRSVVLRLEPQDYTLTEVRNHVLRLRDQIRGFRSVQDNTDLVDGGLSTIGWIGLEKREEGVEPKMTALQRPLKETQKQNGGNHEGGAKKKSKARKKFSPKSTETNGIVNEVQDYAETGTTGRGLPGADAQARHPFSDFETVISQISATTGKYIPSLSTYVPSSAMIHSATPSCLHSLAVSPWDPPPAHLRTQGHLLYLSVHTLEDRRLDITASLKGFYVNGSSDNKFDPEPSPTRPDTYPTLSDLLCQISSSFAQEFVHLQNHFAAQEPLSLSPIPTHLASAPWLVHPMPHSIHTPDPSRLQDVFLQTGARNSDEIDAARDWNEDLQSARELPRSTFAERLARDRALGRLYGDFVATATKGAVNIARRNIAPVNPNEDPKGWLWVWGNIFYTRAMDVAGIFGGAGTTPTEQTRASESSSQPVVFADLGSDSAAHVAASKDLSALQLISTQDHPGVCTLATALVDFHGVRWVAQGIVPGIFRREESSTANEAETARRDGDGPHSMQDTQNTETLADNPNAILYGLTEDHKQLRHHPHFAKLFKPIAKAFRLSPHPMVPPEGQGQDDGASDAREIILSADVKGMIGADGRKYIMECWRMHPVDCEWLEHDLTGPLFIHHSTAQSNESPIDNNESGFSEGTNDPPRYPHKMVLLRTELTQLFWESKLHEWIKEHAAAKSEPEAAVQEAKSEDDLGSPQANPRVPSTNGDAETSHAEGDSIRIDVNDFHFGYNPDAFTPIYEKTKAACPERVAHDEAVIREASLHLRKTILPQFINEIGVGAQSMPLDGTALRRVMHKRGINMRYLGNIAALSYTFGLDSPMEDNFKALDHLVVQEMIVRSIKRLARERLRALGWGSTQCPDTIVKVLNELFTGNGTIRREIVEDVKRCNRYQFGMDYFDKEMRPLSVLREVAIRLGLQLRARDYDLGQIRGGDAFCTADILNMVPIIKHAIPKNATSEETYEGGRQALAQNRKQLALDILAEGLQFYEQYYGVFHPETARAFANVSMLYHQADENSLALDLQRKATIISERVLGIDASEVVQNMLNLGMFEHIEGRHDIALRYLREGLNRWMVVSGLDNPEIVSSLNNCSYILREHSAAIKENGPQPKLMASASPNQHALSIPLAQFGRTIHGRLSKTSLAYANASQSLAGLLALAGQLKHALTIQQEAHSIFEKHLGLDAQATKEAGDMVQAITRGAVSAAMRERKLGRRLGAVGGETGRSLGGNAATNEIQHGQTNVAPLSGLSSAATNGKSLDDLVSYIQGGPESSKPSRKTSKNKKGRKIA